MRRPRLVLATVVLVAVSGLAACGLGTAGGVVPEAALAGPLAEEQESLDGAEISVGSKSFTESILLGKIALILLQAAGADVTDLTNIPGSAAARQALLEGEVDGLWEYTGTAWLTYLGHADPIADEQEQYEAVRDEDAGNGVAWLPPAPMNNTYGFAVTAETQERLGVETLSDIADVPVAQRTFCVESEFANRPDGLNGMLRTYGIPRGSANGVPERNIQIYQTGAIYDATAQGRCNFGEVFTTDGRILALDLRVLEDDKHFFPNYNVAFVVREDVLEEHPEIADLVDPVSAELTDEALTEMNAAVDVDGDDPADVALAWLRDEGFVT